MRSCRIAWRVVLLLGLVARGAAAQGPPGMAAPPPQVVLADVVVKTVPVSYEYVGLTQASKTVEVRARVQGFLESRDFQEGAYVKEGARLFTIDQRSFKADREIAAALVEQAESRLGLAEQAVRRMQSVREPGAIVQSDLDQRLSEQATATAALRLAKAQLAKADLELSYTTVTAPLTGFVGKAQKEIGSLVDPNQNSLLTVMQQVDPLYVSFQVSETDYLTWRREEKAGQLIRMQDPGEPDVGITLYDGLPYEQGGVLDFENVNLDVHTGTVELRATFPNKNRTLKPGQFVKVRLTGWQRPGAITVPQRAVGQSPEGAYVYVVGPDNKAERRGVKMGPWAGQDWIVLEGLEPGERVVVEGLTKVRPGAEVVPAAPSDAGPPGGGSAPGLSAESGGGLASAAAPSEPAEAR